VRFYVMVMADLYFSFTEPMRIQKKMVEAIIDASVNERALYTRSNWPAVTGNIMAFDGLEVSRFLRSSSAPSLNAVRKKWRKLDEAKRKFEAGD
jgi:hypothetical protein